MWTAQGFTLRPATPRDAPGVAALFAEHLQALGYRADPELDADMEQFPRAYAAAGDRFIVAEAQDGELAGMGGLKDGEVRRLFVRTAFRGRGLARRLLLGLIEFHLRQGGRELTAVVARDNPPAYAAFHACGFSGTNKAPDHPEMGHCEILESVLPEPGPKPVAVITGGGQGLGRHLAEMLAPTHRVVFSWRNSAPAARAVAEGIRDAGSWAIGARCDVTRPAQLQFLADLTATVAGPSQVLIHNVGHFSMAPLDTVTFETWEQEIRSTATAAFWAFRAFEAQLLSHARARIITIGDSSADKLKAFTKSLGYYVGKHGVLLVTKAIAAHWRGKSATCNCVSPGVMPNSIDLGEPGVSANVQFAEIGAVIRFLLSSEADAINGAHIIVSRGWNV